MRQNITKKQWDELNDEEKTKHLNIFKKMYGGGKNLPSEYSCDLPNIGQMIEFLGNDVNTICPMEEFWVVELYSMKGKVKLEEELCDALWEAVKYKLKQ